MKFKFKLNDKVSFVDRGIQRTGYISQCSHRIKAKLDKMPFEAKESISTYGVHISIDEKGLIFNDDELTLFEKGVEPVKGSGTVYINQLPEGYSFQQAVDDIEENKPDTRTFTVQQGDDQYIMDISFVKMKAYDELRDRIAKLADNISNDISPNIKQRILSLSTAPKALFIEK